MSSCDGGDRLDAGCDGDWDGDSPCGSPVRGVSFGLCVTVSISKRIARGGACGHPPIYGFCYPFRATALATALGDRRPGWTFGD